MNWLQKINIIQNIYTKEIRETLRDKRTLFIMTLLPILLYPLLMLGMTQLIVYQIDKIGQENIVIAVEGDSQAIHALLLQQNFEIITTTNAWDEINLGRASLGIKIPFNFDEDIQKLEKIPRVLIYYSSTSEKAKLLLNRLQTCLNIFLIRTKKNALKNYPAGLSEPFSIALKNTAGTKKQGAFELGRLLALLVVLMAITFPLYPAIDMAAGEKERGTMETLLVSPATRFEIVMGKYLAIFSIAMLGSILNLASMGFTFQYFTVQSNMLLKSSEITQQDVEDFKATQLVSTSNTPVIFDIAEKISEAYFYNNEDFIITINKTLDSISIWHLRSEKKVYEHHFFKINGIIPVNNNWLLFSEDGSVIEMAMVNGELKLNKVWQKLFPIEKIIKNPINSKIAVQNINSEQQIPQVMIVDTEDWSLSESVIYGFRLLDFYDNYLLLKSEDSLVLWDIIEQKQQVLSGDTGKFVDGHVIIAGNQKFSVIDPKNNLTLSEVTSAYNINAAVTYITNNKTSIIVGSEDGLLQIWNYTKDENGVLSIYFKEYLGLHDSSIVKIHAMKHDFLSLDGDGNVKSWSTSPPLSFSISTATLAKMFILLIPLIALFSALCLGLSIFARSYKEGQHYLTPMVIVVMPLAMIALLPNMNLTLRLCFIPVANTVLLYKEMFLGSATATQTILVFSSTFFYAFLAMKWAIYLFGREDVLFRQVDGVQWNFWRKNKKSRFFSPSQASIYFLITLVLFHLVGAQFGMMTNMLLGQAIAMIVFLVLLPAIVVLTFRYDPKEIFFLQDSFPVRKFLAIFAIAVSSLAISIALATIQNKILPIHTEEMYKAIAQSLQNQPFWLLLIIFAVIPGICEELFFRGFILSSLSQKMSKVRAVVWTAALFAIMHMDISRFSFTFAMGIVLGLLLVKTKNILVPIFVHILCNSLSLSFGYVLEGEQTNLLQSAVQKLYTLLTMYPFVAVCCTFIIFPILLQRSFYLLSANTQRLENTHE